MNQTIAEQKIKKPLFVLTRKNQKGQVAIFVALIFQVVFVFFALLINVGLLVHHKINLQQSTDLAAYYGAMKQAEILNTIAHVNFQVKQAFKLQTWRYRILGTFGFRKGRIGGPPGSEQDYPFENTDSPLPTHFIWNGSMGSPGTNGPPNMRCNYTTPVPFSVGIQDIPFFCVGHAGFSSWSQSESMCNISCGNVATGRTVPRIATPTNNTTPFGGDIAGAIIQTIDSANRNLDQLCKKLGPRGANAFARFMLGYVLETRARTKTIEMLGKDLSLPASQMLDLDGGSVYSGAEKTFRHNLTEANNQQDTTIETLNGLGEGGGGKCKFTNGLGGGTEFMKKIEFAFMNYFIHNCTGDGTNGSLYKPEPVYSTTTPNNLGLAFSDPAVVPVALTDVLTSVLIPGQQQTVGYEKNPYCVEYYAVKATATPNIPFLPLKKIKLSAIAIAKPFGGTIGPWYGKTWSKGSPKSEYIDADPNSKMDPNLPIRDVAALPDLNDITVSISAQPNFSLYVGDKWGLRNVDYIAAFHSMLNMRDIKNYGSKNYEGAKNLSAKISNDKKWPETTGDGAGGGPEGEWNGIDKAGVADFKEYDTLAKNSDEVGTRAIEIAAIAPTQYDITQYSIEPDFYHTYYRRLYKGFTNLSAATGGDAWLNNPDRIRADFGAVKMDPTADDSASAPFLEKVFSVKDQILVKNTVLAGPPTPQIGNMPAGIYSKLLNYLVMLQSSLLTSWTFLAFDDYATFPGGTDVNIANTKTMTFGVCGDDWNKTSDALNTPTDTRNFRAPIDVSTAGIVPGASGNCVTGGRSGYSVKLVTPSMMRDAGAIENPIDDSFFTF